MSFEQHSRESTSADLKWLHKLEEIECDVDGEILKYDVEDFGEYYDGDDDVMADIEEFLDTHDSKNSDLHSLLLLDVFHPIEFTLRCGVRDIQKDEHINKLRLKKAVFIISQVIPRIYHHFNFRGLSDVIARGVTGLLVLILELSSVHTRDNIETLEALSTHFRAKSFLSSIALQIWSVCLYEQGIPIITDRTIPYLRQLAMLDLIDSAFNYAGSWEKILTLLEERHGDLPRIPADKALNESTELLRQARNSIRCHVLELSGLEQEIDSTVKTVPQMYRYYPKCSAYLCQNIESADKPHRLRCYQCHYYHWCSPACQEYSEEAAGHHQPFCLACPETARKEMRGQMQDYLNIPDIGGAIEEKQCHSCGLPKSVARRMNRCSQCKAVYYCSRACQAWDWQHGDHRAKCEPPLVTSPLSQTSL